MKRRRLYILIISVLLIVVFTCSAGAAGINYSAIIQRECQWIGTLQQPSGAIVMNRDNTVTFDGAQYYSVNPYFANIAVMGMLTNPNPGTFSMARAWIGWYFTHLNTKDVYGLGGTIYDGLVDPATNNEYTTGSYQSSSAYAATFLTMLKIYVKQSGDNSYIYNNRAAIESVAGAMLSTLQANNLSFVSPKNQQELLMDNCEVLSGLDAMAYLESDVFSDNHKTHFYKQQSANVQKAINYGYWNSGNQNFDKGLRQAASWSVFYPDCVAQMYPIIFGAINPSSAQAKGLYQQLNLSFPNWSYLAVSDQFYCSVVANVAAELSDRGNVDAYLTAVRNQYIDNAHPWPWTCATAGMTVRAAAIQLQLIQQQQQQARTAAVIVPAVIIGADIWAFGPRRW